MAYYYYPISHYYLQSTCTPKSARSGSRSASLYDELCSSRDSLSYMGLMHSEDLSSTCGSDDAEREEETNTTNVSSFTMNKLWTEVGGRGEKRKREGGRERERERVRERERERERESERERTSVYVSVSLCHHCPSYREEYTVAVPIFSTAKAH